MKDCQTRMGMEASGRSQKTGRPAHDIFYTTDPMTPEVVQLWDRFKDEPIFLEVINALLNLDHGKSIRIQKRA